ncbi:MAG: cytochrome c-type biogenesis protein CcmH [Rhodospirillales bacterium]|nr:cytochrome c-type biogenesis protein CcmH [Alphaproteobacteria bacterium]MBL6947120.1 cytochrome c-type biogenesis protein CcmH [Rhodospirillales bacterium]
MSRGVACILLVVAVTWLSPALAVNPDEVLSDPALEERARDISKGLRCLVCQNQSIDDSDADLAKDLRVLVRERLSAGDSNDAVIQFVVARYGDFVLLKPPFKPATLALWLGPVGIAGVGLLAVFFFFRRRRLEVSAGPHGAPTSAKPPEPLSDDEKRRMEDLLKDDKT